MRSFFVPADLRMKDRLTGEYAKDSTSFRFLAIARWANDPKAADSVAKLLRWGKVVDKLDAAKAGDHIVLDDEDWKTLCEVVERDLISHPPLIGLQVRVFHDAVTGAEPAP